MRVHEALHWAFSFLRERQLEEPVAEMLLRHYLQMDRARFLASFHEELDGELFQRLEEDLAAHASGVPVQHLIGVESFYGRQFQVDQHVLIPRPETEELVLAVLKEIRRQFKKEEEITILDIGTGSGAIAVTLALEEERTNVTAVDISRDALQVAADNARRLGANVQLIHGDLGEPFLKTGELFDVIVSNPPYIPTVEKDTLAVHVRDHEPALALFGGVDGLDVYRRLMSQLPALTKEEKGMVALEIGTGQGMDVKKLMQTAYPKAAVDVLYDLNGKDRIVLAYWNETSY
ncbi:peptide chain release factor N(5)-glutamine methyltransferase [Halalkalibacterium halodurans]|uniref:peptide chain release factor N(5)-glutamine methyltransferase n=1 Tax=Halalkalibacterium halodurans TaxID=86665 RepID=UPI002E1EA951|nr:peptide chain release factor N(5)-glutamine methyltransferase [Halalkalibacterium halodurans]MED4079484.1 peptide chain release factor N(5)-glutamine methyltransferase [Halalkalibacterium halodurans]MED4084239.1 peptide chain release factor N(5)-glutamine methyltransferase [Halalkalibacterium halodurans]MED4104716.1 peptide chain release factor N(5)-glutamine methyltransferase [Halalkalibacterium halodurans]MED4108445.1 peptide chain release factor N(5)-glutamine methyltransferase [Halalkali